MTDDEIEDLETELMVGASPYDAALVCDHEPHEILLIMRSDSPLGVRLRKAEAKAKVASIRVVRQGDWKAHAFFLAARYPEEWAPKKPHTIEAKRISSLTPKELEAELMKRLEMVRAMPAGEEDRGRPILVVDNDPSREGD